MLDVPDFGEPPADARFIETELFNPHLLDWTFPPPSRRDSKWC